MIGEGLVTLDKADGDVDKKKVPQFNDTLWGMKVRKWVVSTKNLEVKKHWPPILQAAASRISDWNADEMDGDEDLLEDDPRAMIVLCEFSSLFHYAAHTHCMLRRR